MFRDLRRVLESLVSADQPDYISKVIQLARPWTRALSAADRLLLSTEAGALAEMCEALSNYRPLLDALADWQRTARSRGL